MPYLGNDLSVIVKQSRVAYKYIATASQTEFTGTDSNGFSLEVSTNSFVSVFLNGVRLINSDDYTVTSNTITLGTGASENDELIIIVDAELTTSTSYTKSETDTIFAPIINAEFAGTHLKVPAGTTAQRPSSSAVGMLRYNTTTAALEQYTIDGWVGIEPPPTITSVTLPGSLTAVSAGDIITINGTTFKPLSNPKIVSTSTSYDFDSYSYVSSNIMTAVIPSGLSEGSYAVRITNPSGLAATYENAFTVDGTPTFNSSAGSLGSFLDYTTITTLDAGATEDGSSVNVQITSGSLPSGLSISSTGAITGSLAIGVTSDTTYNFTVTATDSENQTSTRSFSITVLENYQQSASAIFG